MTRRGRSCGGCWAGCRQAATWRSTTAPTSSARRSSRPRRATTRAARFRTSSAAQSRSPASLTVWSWLSQACCRVRGGDPIPPTQAVAFPLSWMPSAGWDASRDAPGRKYAESRGSWSDSARLPAPVMAPAAAFGPAGARYASWGCGSVCGQELCGQRVGRPPLPVLGRPALLDDQQPVEFVAEQAEDDIGGPHGDEVAVALQSQGLVAVHLGGDVGVGGGGVAGDLPQGCHASGDVATLTDPAAQLALGVGVVTDLVDPGSLEQGHGLLVADGSDVQQFDQQRAFGAERQVDGGDRDAGFGGDRLDGGGHVAALDEQPAGRVQDAAPGGLRLGPSRRAGGAGRGRRGWWAGGVDKFAHAAMLPHYSVTL